MRLRATKRRKAGMNGETGPSRDETAPAVQSAIRAVRRKSLATRIAAAYSSLIAATNPEPEDRTMNATFTAPTRTRVAAFVAAILTSAVVLGATVAGMQPAQSGSAVQMAAVERLAAEPASAH
jgi:hypothetical protein